MRFVYKVGAVILLVSFFLMSHNASAATTVFNINDYDAIHFYPNVKVACLFTNNSNQQVSYPVNVDECSYDATTPSKLRRFYSYNTYSVEVNDIVEFYVVASSDNYITGVGMYMDSVSAGSNLYYIMDVQQVASQDFPLGGAALGNNMYYSVYRFTFKVISSGSWNFGFINQADYFSFMGELHFSMYNISVFRPKGQSQINKEQADATEEAAQNSNTAAQGNSSSTQTTNLIGAFQSFVTALTSLNATNCNVTLAWPSSLGGNMQVNICQNKDYAGNIISVFGSLTLIVFYIPFSLKILSMIYNEIRSFTNG